MKSAQSTAKNTEESAKPHSLNEATAYYKQKNELFVRALNIFISFRDNKVLTEEEVQQLTEMELNLQILTIIPSEKKLLYKDGNHSFLYDIFENTLGQAKILFGALSTQSFQQRSMKIQKLVMQHTNYISETLLAFNNLLNALEKIIGEAFLPVDEVSIPENQPHLKKANFSNENTDFNLTVLELAKMKDYSEAINCLKNQIVRKEVMLLTIVEQSQRNTINDYIDKCKKSINIYQQNLPEQPSDINLSADTQLPDKIKTTLTALNHEHAVHVSDNDAETDCQYSCRQQTLAIYFLLHFIDHKGMARVDNTTKAHFIHFITGKSYHKIYKLLGNPFKPFDSDKKTVHFMKDIDIIIEHFNSLHLKGIVEYIKTNINE